MLLAGCAAGGPDDAGRKGDVYVVRAGDTLFGIARRLGLDHRDLARWNRLGDGTLIYPGQRLRLRPPPGSAARPAASGDGGSGEPPPASGWIWPADGEVLGRFGESTRTASGILVGGSPGAPVVAAAAGEVVYAGSGLPGYGLLIIIRHNASWLTAYGYNADMLVREGEQVRAGQAIGHMGAGAGLPGALHFEIRRNGAPLDPLQYLPARAAGRRMSADK